jgi:esterase/lipase
MFNFSYVASLVVVNLLLWLQSATNKYDVMLQAITAFFSFLGLCASIVFPIWLARRTDKAAVIVKSELQTAAADIKTDNQAQLSQLGEVKTIVNGNTERLQRENAALSAEIERLRNAKS